MAYLQDTNFLGRIQLYPPVPAPAEQARSQVELKLRAETSSFNSRIQEIAIKDGIRDAAWIFAASKTAKKRAASRLQKYFQ